MVQLQIVDILSDDIPNGKKKEFQISIYGKTSDNISIICNVIGFKPYFYLKIPDHWIFQTVSRFLKEVGNKDDPTIQSFITGTHKYDPTLDLIKIKDSNIVKYTELYGFKCNEDKTRIKYNFVKLEFTSHTAMSKYSEAIRKKYSLLKRKTDDKYDTLFKEWFKLDKDDNCDSHLYESNIHPSIRFIHDRQIQPANWISVEPEEDEEEELYGDKLYPDVDIVMNDIDYTLIKPVDNDTISPFVIASFDIECDSSHGDFPLAKKDFKKLVIDLYDSLHRCYNNNISKDTLLLFIKPCIIHGCSRDIDILKEIDGSLEINPIYTCNGLQPSEDSIDEFIELFEDESFIDDFYNLKKRDPVINRLTKELNKLKDEDGDILEVEGDKVIQIGTVFHKYGEPEPYKRHILVIGPDNKPKDEGICDSLDNIEVVCCKSEKALLLGWKNIMKSEDPDFVTGYNIFGFDFAYMYDRMKEYCNCDKKKSRYCDKNCSFFHFQNMGKINSTWWEACYHRNKRCCEKKIKTSTFGSVDFKRYLQMDGRILYDLQKEVEKGHNLESYKLDNVAAHFMRGKIKKIESDIGYITKLYTSEFGNLKDGDYISLRLHSNIGETYYENGKKYKIASFVNDEQSYITLESDSITINNNTTWNPSNSEYFKIEWCLMKDDVSPQDIFEKHKSGGPAGRAEVAKYCIQDCELCINLTLALDIIPNNIAMANVCSVPQSYIYLRGQGAKIFSLIARECDKVGIRIPTVTQPFTGHEYIKMYKSWEGTSKEKKERLKQYLIEERYKERYDETWQEQMNEDKKEMTDYKQAQNDIKDIKETLKTKLSSEEKSKYKDKLKELKDIKEPWIPYKEYSIDNEIDIITDDNPPPRCGYEGAIVLDPEPGIYLKDPVGVVDYASLYPSSIIEKNISHDTLIEDPQYLQHLDKDDYETITYDNYIYEEEAGKVTISKKVSEENPTVTCHFLKRKAGEPLGIIGSVVQQLLQQRKATKKRLKNETNDFKKKVLDGLQLSYKLVANSVYGQMGARTSPIYKNKLAACTTAIGRERIYDAKSGVEEGWWRESEFALKYECRPPKVIYGDTDSVFIKWQRYKNGKLLEGKEALEFCIECGKDAGEWVTENKLNMTFEEDLNIKKPQDLEYEKTFYPFILISKKRYVADKYEFDVNECKRNSMGIVLKRRDNAPIVKHVFGNVIEKIMIDKDLHKSVAWLKETLSKIRGEGFPMNDFIITKSLRGYYKNPSGIAHKVLADRMGERDPGSKPKAGDRMPFAYRVLPEDMLYDNEKKYKSGPRKGQPRVKNVLQGDRIEDPEFIKKNNLKLDYEFYITNQIMNPVKQVLDLEMEEKETSKIFEK